MAPFIVNHPALLNNWIFARETALKKIREIERVSTNDYNIFKTCLLKSLKNVTSWHTESEFQNNKIKDLINDLEKFINFLNKKTINNKSYLFNEIYIWAEDNLNDEGIEYIVSMMMEPYDEIVNPLMKQMSADEDLYFNIPINRTVEDLRTILEKNYSEILKIDFTKRESNQNFWFISKNKEEPRLADLYNDHGLN